MLKSTTLHYLAIVVLSLLLALPSLAVAAAPTAPVILFPRHGDQFPPWSTIGIKTTGFVGSGSHQATDWVLCENSNPEHTNCTGDWSTSGSDELEYAEFDETTHLTELGIPHADEYDCSASNTPANCCSGEGAGSCPSLWSEKSDGTYYIHVRFQNDSNEWSEWTSHHINLVWNEPVTGVPWEILDMDLEDNAYVKNGYLPPELWDDWNGVDRCTTEYSNCDHASAKDCREVLHHLRDISARWNYVVLLTAGSDYCVDGVVVWNRHGLSDTGGGDGWFEHSRSHHPVLRGEEGGVRPRLILKDGVTDEYFSSNDECISGNDPDPYYCCSGPSAGTCDRTVQFDNTSSPSPILWYWDEYRGYTADDPESCLHTYGNDVPCNDWQGNAFDVTFRGFDIVSGNNPGAGGIFTGGVQGGSVQDMRVVLNNEDCVGLDDPYSCCTAGTKQGDCDGFAGMLWKAPSAGGGVHDFEVEGGQYGFYFTTIANRCSSLSDIRLYNQTVSAIYQDRKECAVFTGLDVAGDFSGAAVQMFDGGNPTHGGIIILDGKIEDTGGDGTTAIENNIGETDGRTTYLRNVYFKGFDDYIQTGSGGTPQDLNTKTVWSYVSAYSFGTPDTASTPSPSYDLIDGSKGISTEITPGSITSTDPPSDLVSKWGWGGAPMHPWHTNAYNAVYDGGLDIVSYDDQSSAIQAIIDARGTHEGVFLPRGRYPLKSAIVMPKKGRLFGVDKQATALVQHEDWEPTSQVWLIDTTDDAQGAVYISDIRGRVQLGTAYEPYNYLGVLRLRSGAGSVIRDITLLSETYGSENGGKAHHKYEVSGNGAGKWYVWDTTTKDNTDHVDYRHFYIDGIDGPFLFFDLNIEEGRTGKRLEVNNSSNVMLFSQKDEPWNFPTIQFTDSDNVALLGYCGQSGVTGNIIQVENSTNVLVHSILPQHTTPTNTIYEDNVGTDYFVDGDYAVGMYSKGTFTDFLTSLAQIAWPIYPVTPTITNPTDAETGVDDESPLGVTSAAYAEDETDTYGLFSHRSSDWQLCNDQNCTSVIVESLNSTTNKTTWTIAAENLSPTTTHYLRHRQRSWAGDVDRDGDGTTAASDEGDLLPGEWKTISFTTGDSPPPPEGATIDFDSGGSGAVTISPSGTGELSW